MNAETKSDASEPGRQQKPVVPDPITTFEECMACVTHPAFRLGFLDALRGHPPDHDRIMERIAAETPERALHRLGRPFGSASGDLPGLTSPLALEARLRHDPTNPVAVAQWRYEEGRQAVTDLGLRCRGWGRPDYPPKSVVELCRSIPKEQEAPRMKHVSGCATHDAPALPAGACTCGETARQLRAVSEGLCPECSRRIKDWLPPRGRHLIEAMEELKAKGTDPYTGHSLGCSLNGKLKIRS